MPLLADRTLAVFGYSLEGITPGMSKKIVAQCARCAVEFTCIRKNLNARCWCRACNLAAVPRENYARGIAKRRDTYLARYGVADRPHTAEEKEKRRQTNLERYGVEAPQQSADIRAKTEATNRARYGTAHPIALPATREKSRVTMLARYGVAHSHQSPAIFKKVIATWKKNFGEINPSHCRAMRNKADATTLLRYGTLTPNSVYGAEETRLAEFIATRTGVPVVRQHRLTNGKTLDIFLPQLQVAVEYCGLFWHNELSPEPRLRRYHYDKMIAARADGIRLITLFEDEWRDRQENVENALGAVLWPASRSIGARETTVQAIALPAAHTFLDAHHLQGRRQGSQHAWGLSHAGELVAVMTIGPHHRQGHDVLVLDRLCFKHDVHIAGGATRLFSQVVRWMNDHGKRRIISWSDNRWFGGGVYPAMGFTCAEDLTPDYTYVHFRKPRQRLSKQSQRKKATQCPAGLTEREWALQRGLARIWDCGHRRWEFSL